MFSKQSAEGTVYHMSTGMMFHECIAMIPIDFPMYCISHIHRMFKNVDDRVCHFFNMYNLEGFPMNNQDSFVCWLSATFRVEYSFIKDNLSSSCCGLFPDNRR